VQHDGVDAVAKALHARGSGRGDGEHAPHLALQLGTVGHGAGRHGDGLRGAHLGLDLRQQAGVAVAAHGHGFHHRAAEFARQCCHVDRQALRARHVGHVQCDQHRAAQAPEFEHQPQVHAQVGGVDHGDDRVGGVFARSPAFDHLERDLLVWRGRVQAVGAGQVDHRDAGAVAQRGGAHLALHRDAGVVGDLLSGAGEQVEQRRLAAVRVAHQRDAPGTWGEGRGHVSFRNEGSGRLDLDALRFQPAQGEQRVADLHRQRLPPAGAPAQQAHRLPGDEAELAEPPQVAGIQFGRGRNHPCHPGFGVVGEFGEAHGAESIANANHYQL
jgi:hypothetical protein